MILSTEKKPEVYVHQDYPGLRYRTTGEYKRVNDKLEDAAAEAAGYTKTPPEPGVEAFPAPPPPVKPALKPKK